MSLNKNQINFPSTAQKSIWHTSLFMSTYYEIIPPGIENDKIKYLVKGEKDYYDFISTLYSDMYDNPGKYFIPTIEYDKYMNGRKKEELSHKNDSRECTLRNKFQNSIKFYQDFLYEIGKHGELDPDSFYLIMTGNKFLEIIKKFKLLKKEKENFNHIDTLKSIGFEYKKSDKKIAFFNNNYPMMFFGLSSLAKSKNIKYGYTCFLLCDYRGLIDSFEFKFNDTILILNERYKRIAYEMNELMNKIDAELKIKPMRNTLLNSCWKLQYTKKGKAVYTIHIDIDKMNNFLYFNSVENISKIGYLLKKNYNELFNWFYDNINTMKCSCKNNKIVDIGGQKKRTCGLMNRVQINNPDKQDLEKMKKILEIYQVKNLIL